MITDRDTIDKTFCADCETDTLHEFTFKDEGRGKAGTGKCLSCGKVVKYLKAKKKHKDHSADVSGVPKKRKKS